MMISVLSGTAFRGTTLSGSAAASIIKYSLMTWCMRSTYTWGR